MEKAQQIFDRLWLDYTTQNPAAKKIHDLFIAENEVVENDHIAFRTFKDPRVGIEVLAQPFLDAGYVYKASYLFEDKHLEANHYEHKSKPNAPRVFISQLVLEKFSPQLQSIVHTLLWEFENNQIPAKDLIFAGTAWKRPSYHIYQQLRAESEYAAWLYVYGFRANHFTVSINALKKHNDIRKVNQFLKDHDFLLNDAGGEIKGSKELMLEQSSVKAGIMPYLFTEGSFRIPACYYEFAHRYPDTNGQLFSGFIAKSADKIFESTDYYQ